MSYLSDFLALPSLSAGQAIAAKDLVLMGPTGKAIPSGTTDYSAVANVGASIVSQVSVIGGRPTGGRLAMFRDTDGSIFIAASNSGNNGLKIYKYSITGGTPITLVVNTASASISPVILKKLSNGNFVVTFVDSTALKYAIFDQYLTSVVAETSIETISGPADLSNAYDMIALSGGGFAVTYRQNTNAELQRMAIFSNTGATVLAVSTINTWASTPGNTYTAMVQLSNGNIAIVCNTLFAGSVGTWHAIRTAAGVLVLAFTQLSATLGGAYIPVIEVCGAFYAIATTDGTNAKVWVISNAGVTQGAPYSVASAAVWVAGGHRQKLLSDGTQFWLVFDIAATTQYLLKIPTTGTNYSLILTNLSDGIFDAFIENNMLVYVRAGGATTEQNKVAVFDLVSLLTVVPLTAFGTAPATTNSGAYLAIAPAGDLAFVAVYDYTTTLGTYLCVAKYADSVIVGVAVSAAAVGALVPLAQGVGSYQINALKGTSPKAFNHSRVCNIQGNSGTILANGVTLTGLTPASRNIN